MKKLLFGLILALTFNSAFGNASCNSNDDCYGFFNFCIGKTCAF